MYLIRNLYMMSIHPTSSEYVLALTFNRKQLQVNVKVEQIEWETRCF